MVPISGKSIAVRMRARFRKAGRWESAPEIRSGYRIWLLGMIPLYIFVFGTQILIEPASHLEPMPPGSRGNSANFLSYISIYLTHSLLCAALIANSLRKAYTALSRRRQRRLKLHGLLSCVVLMMFFLGMVSFFDLDIEALSHQVVYLRAQTTPGIAALMKTPLLAHTPFELAPFSILPLSAILIAYWAVILIGFEMATHAKRIADSGAETIANWKVAIDAYLQEMKWCFIRILAILILSSATTAVYFSLGIDPDPSSPFSTYPRTAQAMSTSWGIIFSLMMVFVFITPLHTYQRKLVELRRSFVGYGVEEVAKYEAEIRPYSLLRLNLQYIVGFLMPFLTSFIGPLFS